MWYICRKREGVDFLGAFFTSVDRITGKGSLA